MKTAALFSTAGVLAAGLLYVLLRFLMPVGTGPARVLVPEGATFAETTAILKSKGLVRDTALFKLSAILMDIDKKIAPGYYGFPARLTQLDILNILSKGEVDTRRLTIIEGDSLMEISQKLSNKELVSPEDFNRLTADREFLLSIGIEAHSAEGYLFPDTYIITVGTPPEKILAKMAARLDRLFDQKMKSRAAEIGLTRHEVLTLASIIEKEAAANSERKVISAVFHNRLRRGIPLQADPTAIYGVKAYSEGVTAKDLRQNTSHNTYILRGLPPGPIASPGLESIRAALYPEDNDYIYFVSNMDGTHTFSKTKAEHQRAVRNYRRLKRAANN